MSEKSETNVRKTTYTSFCIYCVQHTRLSVLPYTLRIFSAAVSCMFVWILLIIFGSTYLLNIFPLGFFLTFQTPCIDVDMIPHGHVMPCDILWKTTTTKKKLDVHVCFQCYQNTIKTMSNRFNPSQGDSYTR